MHPFSGITLGIFVAGYITARWDLVTRLYELAIFAWDHGVVTRTAKGFGILSVFFLLLIVPLERIALQEARLHPRTAGGGISAPAGIFLRTSEDDMVVTNGLMRIFWPSGTHHASQNGVLLGWKNSELDFFVVCVMLDVELRSVNNALQVGTLYRNAPHPISQIFDRCGGSPLQVLGLLNPIQAPTRFDITCIIVYTEPNTKRPRLFCPENGLTIQIIIFDRPHSTRMQYMSLTPMTLALDDKPERSGQGTPLGDIEAAEELERERKMALVQKLKLHTVTSHPPTRKELSLPHIIDQINCSFELAALLQRNIGLVGVRAKRALSVSEKVVESATDLWDYIHLVLQYLWTMYIYPVAAHIFILCLMLHRVFGELVLRILDWRVSDEAAALKDISATAQQVDIRLQQFCYWPIQYLTIRKRKANWESITNNHPEYIRFYNSLWLVANDVIIGIALGSYIIENAVLVASQMDMVFNTWSVEGLRRMISWLMEWPGGLKLNTELAAFLGDLFLWVIDHWAGAMSMLRPALPGIIRFIGFSSFAGATMPISLFADLVSLLTLHIYSFYVASARIFNWQLTIIISLFHLFRGKKRNVLRNRIDSCDYELDQLLLGTILFTLLFFLLPTVFVFYLTFASARMAIISVKAGLDTLLACLNHFPLFALMLRIKDSRRLPGGIRFDLQPTLRTYRPTSMDSGSSTSHINLRSVPLPLNAMFHEYFALGNRIRKHYLSPGVFLCLVTGRFVPPIHRKNLYSLQYSMLPARRAGIRELWSKLMEEKPEDRVKINAAWNGRKVMNGLTNRKGFNNMDGIRGGALGRVRSREFG
ncbi:N-acetylglucosaminyl transferase component Gpi1 [Pseudovirgaria hyperparasitica]|uniref:N-acetylglucosaminyl transferase component Gpi1 n=1 Tax=Pseudovirgaria hyperparasitica TaxID=470096 RepID=A0A6A6WDD5_9PEZI|nr:N-acetylglucosaminyl transferase component Gpi1 [Pseudovirgaria hyperparasitica]KAF2760842.1 N-acetylglucosaminyl transferase component Gpi1 [Pseudovirgaria hyperparasitica]